MAKKIAILIEYLDFENGFSKKSAAELPKCSNINKYTINPELDKQPPFELIYRLELVKLNT